MNDGWVKDEVCRTMVNTKAVLNLCAHLRSSGDSHASARATYDVLEF